MAAHLGIEGIEDAEQIGSGGNAVVYRAREVAHDRWVAVKVLRDADDASRRRFDRERRAMGRLSDHEGIVTIHRSGLNADGDPYIVMSLYEHGSLQDHVDRSGAMPWQQAASMAAEIAATVAAAHGEGIVHRDLKPANVLLSASGRPVVADFGISRFVGPTASLASVAMTFSPAFSPPEVMEGAEPSASADIYGIGATLFTLLRGQAPFLTGGDESIYGVMYRVANDPPEDLRAMGVPDALWHIVQRLMAKRPQDRPSDAAAVAAELRSLATAPAAAEPPARSGAPATAQRPRRLVAIVLGLAVALGVGGGLVWAMAGGEDDPDEESEDVVTATPTVTESPTAEAAPDDAADDYVELIRANESAIFGWLADAAAQTVEINDRSGAAQVPACIGASTELAPTATADLLPVVDAIPDVTASSALRNAVEAYLRAFDQCAEQSLEGYISALEDASGALTRFCDRNAVLNQAASGDAGLSGCAVVTAGTD